MISRSWLLALLLVSAFACSKERPSAASASEAGKATTGPMSEEVRVGSALFARTQAYSRSISGNALACTNCHLDGGKQVGGLSLVGAARRYPAKTRDGHDVTLEDRIARCFIHSLSAKLHSRQTRELSTLAAYITWLSEGLPTGPAPQGLRSNAIVPQNLVPIAELDAVRGRQSYNRYCSNCHGVDGQGFREKRPPLPYDYVPPVWGTDSYDDVSGLARVYTLAGFVRHAMPGDQPGAITDRDAQEIAAFVDGQPRPAHPDKSAWDGESPADAVYDTLRYPKNPFFLRLD